MMDNVERALVVDEPWISAILQGKKTWEMRKTACHKRGRVGLIRKGSGLVVGTAVLAASLAPLDSREAYADAEPRHRIPPDRQGHAFDDGWRTPWVLESVRPLLTPVPYDHPNGAVIWVTLQPSVTAAIGQMQGPLPLLADRRREEPRVGEVQNSGKQQIFTPPRSSVLDQKPSGTSNTRQIGVTGGNLRNKHLYLPLDFFPNDVIGGSSKARCAARTVMVTFEPGSTVETDLDGTKRMLCARGEVGDFLTLAGVDEGDTVLVIRTAPYTYTIRKAAHG